MVAQARSSRRRFRDFVATLKRPAWPSLSRPDRGQSAAQANRGTSAPSAAQANRGTSAPSGDALPGAATQDTAVRPSRSGPPAGTERQPEDGLQPRSERIASSWQQALRLWGWVGPHRGALAVVVAVALVSLSIDLVWPLVSAYLVDQVILSDSLGRQDKLRALVSAAVGMAALYFAGAALGFWRSYRQQLINSKFSFSLRSRLFGRVLRLPLSTLSDMQTGGVLSRLSSDVDATAGLLQQALVSPTLALIRLAVTLGIIFLLNVQIALLVVVVIPPILALQALRAGRMRPIWRSMSRDRQGIDGRVSEGLIGLRVVRAFRREKQEELAYTQGHHTVIRKQLLATNIQRSIATIWELILPLAQLTILCFGGYLVLNGETTLGIVVAFQSYLWRLLDPIVQLAGSISSTQRGLAAMDRVFELLDEPPEAPDAPGAQPAPARVERLTFEALSFSYTPGQPVLSEIDLEVKGGTTVALVGPSGAGKTTLTDLLARLYEPTEGRITLNGVDIRQLQRRSYRSLLGVVSQEVFLFDGTLRDNIAYARPGATGAQVEAAARHANAHEFIEKLPQSYDSVIGERGVKLSGGQRQRLSIARALLADPAILILDEATSNLDTESERLIYQSLQTLLRGRTTFVIAHRLSTIAQADQIAVLNDGRIVERGTHAQLMASGGHYKKMVDDQARGPLG